MDRRTIPNNEWQAALDNTVVRKEDMNKLVMDFLVTEVSNKASSQMINQHF